MGLAIGSIWWKREQSLRILFFCYFLRCSAFGFLILLPPVGITNSSEQINSFSEHKLEANGGALAGRAIAFSISLSIQLLRPRVCSPVTKTRQKSFYASPSLWAPIDATRPVNYILELICGPHNLNTFPFERRVSQKIKYGNILDGIA